jgi:ABC-type multidrug transport system fused ATPase/permease subunit
MASIVVLLLRPHVRLVAIVFAAMLLETAMSLAAPWPLKIVLDDVVGRHHLAPWVARLFGDMSDSRVLRALGAAILFSVIAAIGSVASYVDSYYSETVGQWIAKDLRLRVYTHLERVALSYYDQHETAQILSTLTDDVKTIEDFVSGSTLDIVIDATTIAGMIGLMLWLNWEFTLIALAVTPFLIFFVSRFRVRVKKATREVRRRESSILAVLQQGLQSIRVVQAFGREDLEHDRLEAASDASVTAALSARRVKSFVSPVVTLVVAFCTSIVLWRGSELIITGAMTAGTLTVFLAYLGKFFKPVQDLAKMTTAIAQTGVGMERVRTLLEIDVIIPEKPHPVVIEKIEGAIAFDDVWFAYDASHPVLQGVTFALRPGAKMGIVGVTGGGKSTILNLVPRFYDPSRGRVLVDGVDVRDYGLACLRKQIGVVLQDTALFWGTIRENIAYGRPDATDAEIVEAARIANAHDFISATPHGYDTLVGERGVTLSGGERQRIGIARAVVRNAPILLLDEPTAALDSESEHAVMQGLERLMRGRTVITIAHRLSTIHDADMIIFLKDGVVSERGTHAELMALGGGYSALVHAQYDAA